MARRTSVVLVLLGLVTACLSLVAAGGSATAATGTVPRFDHVVVVVEENHSQTNIIGNPDAPFINSLATQNANFTNSFALTHPSQPNYIAMFSGSTQGITDDSCPHSFTTDNLGSQLLGAGFGFTGYSEGLPSAGSTVCTSGKYARKHAPWVDFTNLPASTNQPLSAFPNDFKDLPAVSYVIPNLDNDMHDGTVAQGDAWLQAHLGDYITWAKSHNSLFVLTFDEDDNNNGNRIPTIMAGQHVTPGSYSETINHYSVLRTLEDAYGLSSLGGAATAQPILDVWNNDPSNTGPTAAFTASCPDSTCSFDASTSVDPDGSVASYSWNYGDGQTGSGVTSSHTYGSGGPKLVTLTVTDNSGATDTETKTVTPAGPAPFASDEFERVVTGGWGSADVGGAWSLIGKTTGFSVGSGVGRMAPAIGGTLTSFLGATSSDDTDLTATFSTDTAATGNGVYLSFVGRRVSSGNEYRARLRLTATNTVVLSLSRLVGGTETVLVPGATVPGLTLTPGKQVSARVQVTGTSPTTLRAKVWPAGSPEPTAWSQTVADSTAGLQTTGSVGLSTYVSSSSTNTPVASFSNVNAQHTVTGVPTNSPPTARFTSSCTDLTCDFDGTTSSDSDGTVASYAWTFGDGQSGTGATPEHVYATAGTYTATLTVTDDKGATGSVSHDVTVTAPAGQPLARDTFARTVSNGWGTADVGGPWGLTGTSTSFSVGGGSGVMKLGAGKTLTARLGGVSSSGTDLTFATTADKLTAGYYLTATGRRTAGGDEYRVKMKIVATGAVTLTLSKVVGGTETTLSTGTVSGLTYAAGSTLRMRVQVFGTSPTTVRAKVWQAGGSEPVSWQRSATDSAASLQAPGSIGLTSYLTSSAGNAPLTVRVSDLTATPAP